MKSHDENKDNDKSLVEIRGLFEDNGNTVIFFFILANFNFLHLVYEFFYIIIFFDNVKESSFHMLIYR